MHPGEHAKHFPDKPAVVMADTGAVLTYRQLDQRSNQGAQLFRSLGLRPGDMVVEVAGRTIDLTETLASVLERPRAEWPIAIRRDGDVLRVVVQA